MTDVQITMPFLEWAFVVLMFFIGGKLLQQGGVKYGWGQDWHGLTLSGALIQLAAAGWLFIAALEGPTP